MALRERRSMRSSPSSAGSRSRTATAAARAAARDVERAAEPAHGVLERLRRGRRRQRDHFAVENRGSRRQAAIAAATSGTLAVTSRPVREYTRTPSPALVDLHARAVELVLEGRRSPSRQRAGDVFVGLASIGASGSKSVKPEPLRARAARSRARRARPARGRPRACIARRTRPPALRGRAIASTMTPSSAPCRSSPSRNPRGTAARAPLPRRRGPRALARGATPSLCPISCAARRASSAAATTVSVASPAGGDSAA